MKDLLTAEEKRQLQKKFLMGNLSMEQYAQKLVETVFGLEPEELNAPCLVCGAPGCDGSCIDEPENSVRNQCNLDKDRYITCTRCGLVDADQVEERYSFGIYAGRLCVSCCAGYRDNCGIDRPQGDPTTLDEFEAGGYDAIYGEDY